MPTSIRLYLDENVNPEVAEWLIEAGIDALTAREAGMLGASDEEHLVFAAESGRVLFTHDFHDFPSIASDWASARRQHCGILIAHQDLPSAIAKMIADVQALYEKLDNITMWLPAVP